MDIEDFGRALVTTGDLDPIYVILVRANLDPPILQRWLVAYWLFYHAGVSSRLAESRGWMQYQTALDEKWPRGTERRHFRGDLAQSSLDALRQAYSSPEAFYVHIATTAPIDLAGVIERVKAHRGFGPWIAFKVADILERVCSIPLEFDQAAVFLFDSPAEAVDAVWEQRVGPIKQSKIDTAGRRERVITGLLERLSDLRAPPTGDRPLGLAEAETILCKWLSHIHGHYPIGKDAREIKHHLEGYGPLAERLSKCLSRDMT